MSDQDFILVDEEEKESTGADEVDKEEKKDHLAVKKEEEKETEKDNDDDGYEKICLICHRPESVAGKMIEMPNHITVCRDCMQRSFDAMTDGSVDLSRLVNMPGVQFLNLSDLDHMQPKAQKIKKKKEKPKEFHQLDIKKIPAPHKIKARLDEYVVGQEKAKKAMAVAVYNHYKRVASDTMDDIEIEKSNMLMIGPTGSGKTYLVKTLAKLLDVPLAITDATSLTEAGYIGDDIESVVSKLLAAADNDVERAEQGIIFIDEIDKIAKKHTSNQRDVSGESVQQGMLKLLEGSEVEVPVGANSKNAMVPLTTVNTKNILFICAGAFPDLEDIIKEFGGTTLFVSHNRDEIYRICDRVCVMNRGQSSEAVPIKELFAAPVSREAAYLSGCKNFSDAAVTAAGEVMALDWGITLQCDTTGKEDASSVGVRSHFIHPVLPEADGTTKNVFPCKVERVIEDVFSYILIVSTKEEARIRVDVTKEQWQQYQKHISGNKIWIGIDEKDVMLLK